MENEYFIDESIKVVFTFSHEDSKQRYEWQTEYPIGEGYLKGGHFESFVTEVVVPLPQSPTAG